MVTEDGRRIMDASKLVSIVWVDAMADSGWEHNVKADVYTCLTVGFLVHETKDAICIANTLGDDFTNSNCRMHIPKKWIVERKEFNIVNKLSKVQGQKASASSKGQNTPKVSATLFKGRSINKHGSRRSGR